MNHMSLSVTMESVSTTATSVTMMMIVEITATKKTVVSMYV